MGRIRQKPRPFLRRQHAACAGIERPVRPMRRRPARRDFRRDFASCAKAGVNEAHVAQPGQRSEEHTSELQSLMRISYAVFCLKKKITLITIIMYKDTTCQLSHPY